MCKSPPLGDVYPHLEDDRLIHLLRKLYEYRLVIDILFGISAEVSCQRSFCAIRACTVCCCFCLILLSSLHPRNRRRFVVSIRSIDRCCSTKCFVAICTRSIQYGRRASRTWYCLLCCLLLYERVTCFCARWRMEKFCFFFPTFSFFSLKNLFKIAPLGNSVALPASSCIPVRLQPLRACAEPPVGVSPQWRSPPSLYARI